MSDESRRKLLKILTSASGVIVTGKCLPDTWTKPIIDSVILPGHARTSATDPDNPDTPCTQCGDQMLTDGIGLPGNWDSTLVNYDSTENSYRFLVGSSMRQFVVLSDSCVGSTLRLNLGDGGGTGPLTVSVAVGNTVQDTTYTGGGLVFDVPVPAGPTSPALIDIRFGGTPFDDSTKILDPTLTVIC